MRSNINNGSNGSLRTSISLKRGSIKTLPFTSVVRQTRALALSVKARKPYAAVTCAVAVALLLLLNSSFVGLYSKRKAPTERRWVKRPWCLVPPAVMPAAAKAPAAAAAAMGQQQVPAELDALADDFISALGALLLRDKNPSGLQLRPSGRSLPAWSQQQRHQRDGYGAARLSVRFRSQ